MSALDFWRISPEEFRSQFSPPFRGDQFLDWYFTKDVVDPSAMHNIPKSLREDLCDQIESIQPLKLELAKQSSDGSIKYLFDSSGTSIESVWMPFEKHNTLCMSTQSGCRMGCTFCATARMSKTIDLSVSEILGQISFLRAAGKKIDRIVFMGMGEPLQNFENLSMALDWITHSSGYCLSPRRITVSTVGYMPNLDRFWDEREEHLAISLNGFDNKSRQEWMPVANKWSFDKLIEWTKARASHSGQRRITFEYILAGNHTDHSEAAMSLASALKGIPVRVNLIPWNGWETDGVTPTTEDSISNFAHVLSRQDVQVTVRRSRALDVDGACGQLATKKKEGGAVWHESQ